MGFSMHHSNPKQVSAQKRRRGLNNTGKNCYMNSVIQALMCDDDLIQLLRERLAENRSSSMPASRLLAFMADRRYQVNQIPFAFKNLMAARNPQFGIRTQQDAQEFLTLCLDVLKGEYSGNEGEGKSDGGADSDTLSRRFEVLSTGDSDCHPGQPAIEGLRNESPIHAQSLGYSLTEERIFQCTKCGIRSNPVEEHVLGLSLSIPSQQAWIRGRRRNVRPNLQTMIRDFFKPERIDRRCPQCGCENAVVETRVSNPPRCLVVNIKRFSYDLRKVTTPVMVPQELSLPTAKSRDSVSRRNVYTLKAVIRHRSKSITRGHYVADILEADGTWTCCNDSRVFKLNGTWAQTTEGYIFFYYS